MSSKPVGDFVNHARAASASVEPGSVGGLVGGEFSSLRAEYDALTSGPQGVRNEIDIGSRLNSRLPTLARALREDMNYDQYVNLYSGRIA